MFKFHRAVENRLTQADAEAAAKRLCAVARLEYSWTSAVLVAKAVKGDRKMVNEDTWALLRHTNHKALIDAADDVLGG